MKIKEGQTCEYNCREFQRDEVPGANPPESPFGKGGELLSFLKGEREGFKQGLRG